jgi:hypothetical protein
MRRIISKERIKSEKARRKENRAVTLFQKWAVCRAGLGNK